MDSLKRLRVEFSGIKKAIEGYTSGSVLNHLDQLESAIAKRDMDVIIYCLQEIQRWYGDNIGSIHANEFVYNHADHDRNKKLVEGLLVEMQSSVLPDAERVKTKGDDNTVIFLSHRSSDKQYADALRDFIVGLGIVNSQLIYTSHPLHKIPLGEDIYGYLRRNFSRRIFVIFLWSDKYLESPACLNEMGAAWVTQAEYTHIFVPGFNFSNPKFNECAINTRTMGIKLGSDAHCRAGMLELKNRIQELFKLNNHEQQSDYLLGRFIRHVTEESYDE